MKTICLVIGHSSSAQGARNDTDGETEWTFNYSLACRVMAYASNYLDRVDLHVIHRGTDKSTGYELAATVEEINRHEPDLVVSLHSNAYDKRRQGHAVLHYTGSKAGRKAAEIFMHQIQHALGNLDKGIRERKDLALLSKTKAPAVILEPFFIDNLDDLDNAQAKKKALGFAIFSGIMEALKEGT